MKQERPPELPSTTTRVPTGLGNMYLTVTFLDRKPFELFATISKSGKEVHAMTEAIGRLISLWLRNGNSIEDIVDQLLGITGDNPLAVGKGVILSIPDGIAQMLQKLNTKGGDSNEKPDQHIFNQDGGSFEETGDNTKEAHDPYT